MINSFLLIGQSNMAGRGDFGEVPEIVNKDVFMFRDEWVIAKEPVHTDKDIAAVGLASSFADTLQKKYQKQIGLIACAVGGSALDEWQKGRGFYENAVSEAKKAMKSSKLKGILWHQGEHESGSTDLVKTYEVRFIKMLNDLKSDLGLTDIPIVIGELGTFTHCPYWAEVNKELNRIAEKYDDISIVSSAGLKDRGDTLHFNSVSLREFGVRYANVYDSLSKKMKIELE